MSTIVLDTHKTIKKLREKGYSQEQAEGFVDALSESNLLSKDYFEARLYKALLIHGLSVVGAILGGALIVIQLLEKLN